MINWKEWNESIADALAYLNSCEAVLTQVQFEKAVDLLPGDYPMLNFVGDLDASKDLNRDSFAGILRLLPFATLGDFFLTSCQNQSRPNDGKFSTLTVLKNDYRVELRAHEDYLSAMLSERNGPVRYKRFHMKEYSFTDTELVLEWFNYLFTVPRAAK